jgi:hypothetical protein
MIQKNMGAVVPIEVMDPLQTSDVQSNGSAVAHTVLMGVPSRRGPIRLGGVGDRQWRRIRARRDIAPGWD